MMNKILASLLLLCSTWTQAATYYFVECSTGAHASCAANVGDNARSAATAQTSTTPWQNLAAIDTHLGGLDSLPAGTVLRFARGGAWASVFIQTENLNATASSRITFEDFTPAWGGSAAPIMHCGATACVSLGNFGSTTYDGGYTFRNFKFDGTTNTSTWCVTASEATQYVTLTGVEVTGCGVGIQSNQTATLKNRYWLITSSNIHHNTSQGILGGFSYSTVERNTFTQNATDETPGFGHNYYIGAGSGTANLVVRFNTFYGSGAGADGACANGHITGHGQLDSLVVEGNKIESTSYTAGCGGINLNPAYDGTQPGEYCRNCIVRGNTLINAAAVGIAVSGAPGIVIENNWVVQTISSTVSTGFAHPGRNPSIGGSFDDTYDDADSAAVFRNNGCYFGSPSDGAICINFSGQPTGTGLRMIGNLAIFATASGTQRCWGTTTLANFTTWNWNLCFGADEWSDDYATHALAHAAGYDTWSTAGGLADNDPLIAAVPSSGNGWACTLSSGSPALNVGGSGLSRLGIKSAKIVGTRDIGPCER